MFFIVPFYETTKTLETTSAAVRKSFRFLIVCDKNLAKGYKKKKIYVYRTLFFH